MPDEKRVTQILRTDTEYNRSMVHRKDRTTRSNIYIDKFEKIFDSKKPSYAAK